MQKFYIKDCPDNSTIANWIKSQTNWDYHTSIIKPTRKFGDFIKIQLNIDLQKLLYDVKEATQLYGDYPWAASDEVNTGYTGFSLVYNKNHQDGLDEHCSTMGTPKNKLSQYYWNQTDNHSVLKNSYYDTYSFVTLTKAAKHKSIGELTSKFNKTIIRSRMSILKGSDDKSLDTNRNWHKDEVLFENFRINIPLQTCQNYYFQFQNKDPSHLPVGYGYSFNPNIPHRVYSSGISEVDRYHLVIGVSPWFDYSDEEECWIKNEFFGKKHPFDMLVDGEILNDAKVI